MPAIQMPSRSQATPSLDYWPISLAAGAAGAACYDNVQMRGIPRRKNTAKIDPSCSGISHSFQRVGDIRHTQKNHARKLAQRSSCIVKLVLISITLKSALKSTHTYKINQLYNNICHCIRYITVFMLDMKATARLYYYNQRHSLYNVGQM